MKQFKLIAMAFALVTSLLLNPMKVEASGNGNTFQTAVDIAFGQNYTKSWDKNSYDLNHYSKIVVPTRGIITINATKPFDSESKYGQMEFCLYNSSNVAVWGASTYYSVDDASSSYIYHVGLDAGTYYLTLKPRFYVYSGKITTTYNVSFKSNSLCEVEPNETIGSATKIALNQMYVGYFGSDGYADYVEENDYWRVYLEAGKDYRFRVGNYVNISTTTTILTIKDPNGEDAEYSNGYSDLDYKIKDFADAEGVNYVDYTAPQTGWYSICFDNYGQRQFEYTVGVYSLSQTTGSSEGTTTGYPTSYNGMGLINGNWYYLTNGEINWTYTGMACNEAGWWYFRNGQLDWTYTGMACNEYGWWYYQNGQLNPTYTGMACNEYGWWYYQNGQLNPTYTGMACNEYGWWYYQNGRLNSIYTGMACNEYGWWYYTNGRLDMTYTGPAQNEYGTWWFQDGRLVL